MPTCRQVNPVLSCTCWRTANCSFVKSAKNATKCGHRSNQTRSWTCKYVPCHWHSDPRSQKKVWFALARRENNSHAAFACHQLPHQHFSVFLFYILLTPRTANPLDARHPVEWARNTTFSFFAKEKLKNFMWRHELSPAGQPGHVNPRCAFSLARKCNAACSSVFVYCNSIQCFPDAYIFVFRHFAEWWVPYQFFRKFFAF